MKLEWGKKVTCPACAMHFYDMMKSPAVCPHCGNTFDTMEIKSRRRLDEKIEEDNMNADFEFDVSSDDDIVMTDEADSLDDDLDTNLNVSKNPRNNLSEME